MTVFIVSAAVFGVTLALCVSMLYFFLGVSASRDQLRLRFQAVRQSPAGGVAAKPDVISPVDRMIADLPGINALRLYMLQGAVQIPVATFILLISAAIIGSLVVGLALRLAAVWLCTLTAVVAAGPMLFITYKRRKRLARFEELFPDAIDTLARAVRAGHPFTTAFSFVALELPEPVGGEFRITFEQQNLGVPLPEALRNMASRLPIADVEIFVTALSIQRESGGNLAEILDNLSAVVRDRFRILRQVRIHAAEGRLSMYVLTALPPVAGLAMYFLNPEYMMRLFTDSLGQKAVAVAAGLQIVGYLLIRRIIRIRV